MSGQLGKEGDLAKILIYLQFLYIGVRLLLHYHHCSFSDEIHFGSLLVFFEDMVVHGESLIEEEEGDLGEDSDVKFAEDLCVFEHSSV